LGIKARLGKDHVRFITMVSIVIADDNNDMRQGLKNLLEAELGWQVVGEAVNGREALERAAQLTPEVVILDISMPELDGISAARLIGEAVPQTELLVLSQHDAPDVVARALAAGVRGYVLKSQASRDLVPAVEAVRRHASFLSAEISVAHPSVGTDREKNGLGGHPGAGPSKNSTCN
jgi:DNA-binding NarL/FixJ family response regulator